MGTAAIAARPAPAALPGPYAEPPSADALRPAPATLGLVRDQVQALLLANPSFHRMGGTERGVTLALSLAGLGVLIATAVLGGRLVFEHAAGIPTGVLQEEIHERAEGHHHHGGEADEADHHDDSATPGAAAAPDSARPAGHTHAPGTPPHQD